MSEIKEFSAMSLWNNLSTNKKMAAILSEPAQHIQKKKKKKKLYIRTKFCLFIIEVVHTATWFLF